MAYFDNAATTYPKPDRVYSFMDEFYRKCGGNVGRGDYGIAKSAGALVADTRMRLQELLHCPAKQVVFTPTAMRRKSNKETCGLVDEIKYQIERMFG